MNQSKMKIIVLLGIVLLMLSFSSCRFINKGKVTRDNKIKQDAETIMEGIKNSDYESIQEIFSPYVKQRYPDLQSDIAELMGTIEGNIVSYDAVSRSSTGGHSDPDGWIERSTEGTIRNVKTDQDKTYTIKFEGYEINRDKPEKVGVRYIGIRYMDDLDEDGDPKRKSIYYE